jgi:hypothetical protein
MPDKTDPATPFIEMAERIAKNPDEFQGAYVVVGPDGIVVSNAFFGPKPNVALFWSTAKNHVSVEADAAAQAAERNNQAAAGYGRR